MKDKYNPGKELKAVIQEACMKFDLSPKDADFLLRKLLEHELVENLQPDKSELKILSRKHEKENIFLLIAISYNQ